MAEKEQVKPLAPTQPYRFSDDDHHFRRRRSYVKICGCVSAILVITAVTLIVLAFTVFHVRGPIVWLNSISTVGNLTDISAKSTTLTADVSVKNPNAASFRFSAAPTTIFYDGSAVGEGWVPAGVARARRTLRTNLTVEIAPAKIMASPRLAVDFSGGALTVESFTRIEGRVKIANIVKRKVVVQLNCTLTYDIMSSKIQRQNCKHDVNI